MTTALQRGFRNLMPRGLIQGSGGYSFGFGGNTPQSFQNYAFAYQDNAIIYAGMNLIATSAAEPHIIGKRYRRNKRSAVVLNARQIGAGKWDATSITLAEAKHQAKAEDRYLRALGVANHAGSLRRTGLLVRNGYFEEIDDHPLIQLLNNPQSKTLGGMSRGQLWGLITLDYHLAGNAYLLKARYQEGLLAGAVGELWRLRPDRVKVIPGTNGRFIDGYEYGSGADRVIYAPEDIMHFKTLNPANLYYGQPVLSAVRGRIAIDNYMQMFLSDFYSKGGTGPGAIFSTKGKMSQKDKDDGRERFERSFGPGHFSEVLFLDNADGFTYTPLSLNRGLRDALPSEIDAQTEARLAMVMGVPGAIMGLLIGYETSSYANQRQAWQVVWDVKMTPMLSDFDDVINLSLVPEFSGIDEVCFDLSDIRALQEDEDKMQERARRNLDSGGMTIEEFRPLIGLPSSPNPGEHLLLPTRSTLVPTPIEDISPENPAPLATPGGPQQPAALFNRAVEMIAVSINESRRAGRTRIEDDPEARADYDRALDFKSRYPGMTWAQIADRIGRSARQLREIRARFDEDDDE